MGLAGCAAVRLRLHHALPRRARERRLAVPWQPGARVSGPAGAYALLRAEHAAAHGPAHGEASLLRAVAAVRRGSRRDLPAAARAAVVSADAGQRRSRAPLDARG